MHMMRCIATENNIGWTMCTQCTEAMFLHKNMNLELFGQRITKCTVHFQGWSLKWQMILIDRAVINGTKHLQVTCLYIV